MSVSCLTNKARLTYQWSTVLLTEVNTIHTIEEIRAKYEGEYLYSQFAVDVLRIDFNVGAPYQQW